ncbi:MAG TPA: ABC transporter ATP-binding protein [Hyphomicrobiaceae bacterium]|nr:ABC transporter ATP-binding protein [Hyphomicrobiaceae bacterium]
MVILDDVHIEFPIYGAARSLRSALFASATGGLVQRDAARHKRVVVKALNGISFTLRDGDRLGLVGGNGAGKSTLLKVMAGIYRPVAGQVRVSGRITPCLGLLPGLDLEDTGYDNIITGGLFLGLTRAAIERKIPDIEELSGLGEYLALPVRTYSAGMLARLGFAVATAVEPGILLVDEGIGAGDASFAERAARRRQALVDQSSILVLASHADDLIRSWCNKAALLEGGRLRLIGEVDEVLDAYHCGRLPAQLPAAAE